jgi:chromosomal replication initiator protein
MTISDPSLWRDMLTYLRRHHAPTCRQWFDELEPVGLDNGLLRVRAQNPIQQNYLQNRCLEAFNEAAQSVTGALLAVRFVLGLGEEPHEQANVPVGVDNGQIVLSPDYSFENFVTGPGNNLAQAAAVAVSEQPGRAYNPLFLHGGVGLGKTHLLQAICQTVLKTHPDARICYLSCDTFINHFMEAVQGGRMKDFRNRYRHVDLLLIDDIHFLAKRERTQEEFFHTFNTLYQSNKQIVISCDSPPDEIPQLEERLISRFNWGLVARIDRPCYETRVAIIKTKSKVRDIDIPNDVACYIAEQIDSNTRELEGAITKIQSLAALRTAPIDLKLARQALGEDPSAQDVTQLTIQNIIDAVTAFYGVKLADLQSKRRNRSITMPRQICMYLARKRTRYSLEEIGGYFGGRDHTTVMHAVKATEQRIATEPGFGEQVEQLDAQLVNHSGMVHA